MDIKINPQLKLGFFVLLLGVPAGFLFAYFLTPPVPGVASPAGAKYGSPFGAVLSLSQSTDSGRVLGSFAQSSLSAAPVSKNQTFPSKVLPAVSQSNSSSTGNSAPSASTDTSSGGLTVSNSSSSSSNNDQNQTNQSIPDSAEQQVLDSSDLVITYLKGVENEDGIPLNHLYNLMSQDFKTTYSEADFALSFSGAHAVVGGVSDSVPKIYGPNNDWAEQSIKLTLSDGATQEYTAVFHFENGGWRLYATQEL